MTDYTVWLEEHATKLAAESGRYRGLLDIALSTMKLSGDPFTESEAKWIEERLKNLDKEEV